MVKTHIDTEAGANVRVESDRPDTESETGAGMKKESDTRD